MTNADEHRAHIFATLRQVQTLRGRLVVLSATSRPQTVRQLVTVEGSKKLMKKNQRTFFIVMGTVQVLIITAMAGWMLLDAYKAITSVSRQPIPKFLLEPILWHKIGEILVVFPIGIAFAAFYIFWKPDLRSQYLRITTPLMIMGGVFNLIAFWGFYQKPRTEFTSFMIYFCPLLFLAGLGLPFLLRWVHRKRLQVENKAIPQT